MGIKPVRMGHFALATGDLAGMVAFYQQTLGMEVSDRMPYSEETPFTEGVWLRLNTDHHVISMFGLRDPGENSRLRRRPRPGIHHIAFEVARVEDLIQIVRYARESGIGIQGTRIGGPGCMVRAYIWDPDDNMIELYWGMDQIGWNGESRPYPPVETVDLETFDFNAWLDSKGPDFKHGAPPVGVESGGRV